MINQDIAGSSTSKTLLAPQARTSSANGTGLDVSTYEGLALVQLANGTTSGTTPTLDVKIQDSAANSTFADVTGYTFTQVTAALSDPSTLKIDLRNVRQYIRAVATIAGTTPSFACAVTLVASKKITP